MKAEEMKPVKPYYLLDGEEQDLMERDMCARIPYCPKFHYFHEFEDGDDIDFDGEISEYHAANFEIKPDGSDEVVSLFHCRLYLRPISSLTFDEICEIEGAAESLGYPAMFDIEEDGLIYHTKDLATIPPDMFDVMNRLHIDYRGLIAKGLALEAPQGMYNEL